MRPTRPLRFATAALALSLSATLSGTIATAAQAQTKGPAPAKAAAPAKTRPVPGSTPVVGVNLYDNENYSLSKTEAWGQRDLAYIAYGLKLKAVSIDWDYNVPSVSASYVQASKSRTPTIADLKALTEIARSYGLSVEYRVLFAIGNKDVRSRSIKPKDFGHWLFSLLGTEEPALELAQSEHVSTFV